MFPRGSAYEYSNCKIIIATKKGEWVKEIQEMKARDTHIEFDFLKKGEYRMYIEIKWNEETEEEHRVVHATSYG